MIILIIIITVFFCKLIIIIITIILIITVILSIIIRSISWSEIGRTSHDAHTHHTRRRENMVGVNMVLAEFVKFKHGLYKSCGIECFEGIVLEPCLLQPHFHVAGSCCSICYSAFYSMIVSHITIYHLML